MPANLPDRLIEADDNLNLRLLALLGGLGLLCFEIIYLMLDAPTGPFWLRVAVTGLCITFFLVLHYAPHMRRYDEVCAGGLAYLITAENIYRMYLVDFALMHSLPMLIVLIGACYAFRNQLAIAIFVISGCSGLTIAMALSPTPEISPNIYIASAWAIGILILIIFGSIVEQHSRVQTQDRLLNSIFEQSFGGLLLIDRDQVLLANERARELLHAGSDEDLLSRVLTALQKQHCSNSKNLIDYVLHGELREEIRLVRNAQLTWLEINLRSIDLDGQQLLLMNLYDISTQRDSIHSLRRSELFLERSQRIGALGSWEINLDTGQLLWSAEMFNIYGIQGSPQPSLEASVLLLEENSRKRCRDTFDQVVKPGDRASLMMQTNVSGVGLKYLNSIAEYIELEGTPHLVGITQDVTSEIKHEQDLIAAKEAAEQALEVRGTFLANMSHEIRTPMNGVIGMTSLLLSSELDEEQRDQIQTIKHSGESLLHLINDLLDYSKIDAEKVELDNHVFNLHSILHGPFELLKLEAEEKSIDLNLEIDEQIPDQISGDSKRLEQIVINLANNAVKFTKAGGVDIRFKLKDASRRQCWLKLEVTDSGIGIAPNKIEKLFEAFAQEDSSTTRRFGGTGLGLSITKGLVTLMGGLIDVESNLGIGTTFRVSLPFTVPSDAAVIAEDSIEIAADLSTTSQIRILLAEDNLVNQKVARKMLQRLGHEPILVGDGTEAVAAFDSNEFDLVLMDLQMPELDGLDATRRIRELDKVSQPVVIALTANAMESDKEACLSAGMNAFLAKPLTLEELSTKLDEFFPRTS